MATVTAYPFDGTPTTEDQYAALAALYQDPGVVDVPGGAALQVSADGSGMVVQVNDGAAFHQGFLATVTGGDATVAIADADTTARTDKVVLRIDTTTNTGSLVALKGGATPDADGPHDVLLGYVNVPGSAVVIAGANVTDARQFVGLRVGGWLTRPTGRNAMGYNFTLNRWEYTVDLGVTWLPLGLQYQVVDAVPASPAAGTLYLVRV